MKRKGKIEIGRRFVEEMYRLDPGLSDKKISALLGSKRSSLNEWKNGVTPGGMFLARAGEMGADIDYILLGRKRYPVTESDHDICEFEEET